MPRRNRREAKRNYHNEQTRKRREKRARYKEGTTEDSYQVHRKAIDLSPRTENQWKYVDYLSDSSVDIVFGIGPAGTGKTMLASTVAAKMLHEAVVDRIVIIRPAVGVDGEKHGFLPGTVEDKMMPWIKPVLQQLSKVYHQGELQYMLKAGTISVEPIAYIRGMTFENSVIILDEAQNCSVGQLKAVLTRIGEGSCMFVTGDLNQKDEGRTNSGLQDFVSRLGNYGGDRIAVVRFDTNDIQRHPVVGEVLRLYGEE